MTKRKTKVLHTKQQYKDTIQNFYINNSVTL